MNQTPDLGSRPWFKIVQARTGIGKTTTAQESNLQLWSTAQRASMTWTKPTFTDIRFGFEITMYVLTR